MHGNAAKGCCRLIGALVRVQMKESERANENETKFESSERAIQHLENKIAEYRSEAVKARNIILMLEREREKFGIQVGAVFLGALDWFDIAWLRLLSGG